MDDRYTYPFRPQESPDSLDKKGISDQKSDSDSTVRKTTGELGKIKPPAMRASEFVAGVLYLYVAGAQNQKPIQHQGKEMIILGRSSNSTAPNPAALIDLNPYRALSLGVSRQHARINYSDGGYTIEDLNSSNGTWLNGNRLSASQIYRIRPGDHVQLGELLMFIYYV